MGVSVPFTLEELGGGGNQVGVAIEDVVTGHDTGGVGHDPKVLKGHARLVLHPGRPPDRHSVCRPLREPLEVVGKEIIPEPEFPHVGPASPDVLLNPEDLPDLVVLEAG